MKLTPYWRQKLVNFIIILWPVMPLRARVWAFMNDGELQDDYKFHRN
jgi:hypothetical protein